MRETAITLLMFTVTLGVGIIGYGLGKSSGYEQHKMQMLRKMGECIMANDLPPEFNGLPEEVLEILYDAQLARCWDEKLLRQPIKEQK